MHAEVKNAEGLERDLRSGAVVAKQTEYEKYLILRSKKLKEKRDQQEIINLRERVSNLENMVLKLISQNYK